MKQLFILQILLVMCMESLAQEPIKARTENGTEVLLYPDGKWEYAKPTVLGTPVDLNAFSKPINSRKEYLTKSGNFRLWYDESKWKPSKSSSESVEMQFALREGDGYTMIIAEEIEIPTESLKKIAIKKMQSVATDSKIVTEEERIVNGVKLSCLQMEATVSGIELIYYGYYYGGEAGAIQLVTFTGKNVFKKYKKIFSDMLNGLETVNQ